MKNANILVEVETMAGKINRSFIRAIVPLLRDDKMF